MVVDNTFLDKAQKTCQIMRTDLTDQQGLIIVTLVVPNDLIEKHNQTILLGKLITVTNFQILPKTNYDRGNCDDILLLDNTRTVENISLICTKYKFIPNATIKQLRESIETFPIATIATLVITTQNASMQYTLKIK